jgi:hypothetical protein
MDPISMAQTLTKSSTIKIITYSLTYAGINTIREDANNLGYLKLQIIKIIQLNHSIIHRKTKKQHLVG